MTVTMSNRSGRAQLQRELGELGEVMPYMYRGAGACLGPGWYARIDGEMIFLGGHLAMAFVSIAQLKAKA